MRRAPRRAAIHALVRARRSPRRRAFRVHDVRHLRWLARVALALGGAAAPAGACLGVLDRALALPLPTHSARESLAKACRGSRVQRGIPRSLPGAPALSAGAHLAHPVAPRWAPSGAQRGGLRGRAPPQAGWALKALYPFVAAIP